MKQLKFMLAAATAVGLAAVAQAAVNTVKTIDNENFEDDSFVADTAATNYPGYSFAGENPADDESVIKAGGYNSTKALQVNTGTDPLLRALKQTSATAQKLDLVDFSGVNIDTMVQFTVTPAGDKVTATAGDKLMIYLAEATNDVGDVTGTNLVVKAAAYEDGAFVEGGRSYVASLDEGVVPNSWYRLVVKARAVRLSEEGGYWPLFQVYLGGDTEDHLLYTYDESGLDNINEDIDFTCNFLSLQIQSEDGEAEDADTLNLQYVGFAGEGMVDDLTVATLTEVNTLDFTFTWSGDGIKAVTYTIGENTYNVESGTSFAVDPGASFTVDVALEDWYSLAAGTKFTYSNVAEGDEVALGSAVKVADVTTDPDTGAEKIVVTETTTPAQVGIKEGYFASESAGSDKLGKVLTWATAKGGATAATAGEVVGALVFNEETESLAEQAYLLDCAVNEQAVEKAKEDFVLTGFTIGADGVLTFGVGEAGKADGNPYGNGKIEVRGKATLGAEKWVKDCPGASFFKAFLVP